MNSHSGYTGTGSPYKKSAGGRRIAGIVILLLLVAAGVAGIWILRSDVRRILQPTAYYTRYEAECFLKLLPLGEAVIGAAEGDMDGFTAADARNVLNKLLTEAPDTEFDYSEEEALSFLNGKKDAQILSEEEFRLLYEYLIVTVKSEPESESESEHVEVRELLVLDSISSEESEALTIVTPECNYMVQTFDAGRQEVLCEQLNGREDAIIRVYVAGNQILEYTGEGREGVTLSNVWIEGADASEVQIFLNGYHRSYPCNIDTEAYGGSLQASLADVRLGTQGVTDIILKSDRISAKVLAVYKDGVEVEGYGKLGLSEHYHIYKIYGELAVEPTSQILVGYKTTNFVVADGVIEAALITEPIHADKIRVVLGNSDYTSLMHPLVRITADCPYTMNFHGEEKTFEAGEELELTMTCGYMAEGRVTITPNEENGRLQILSITRNGQNPSYRGSIEVAPYEESGLTIVNELSMEEYLYTVVPSEMPISYGQEALQVQAICARGYAYAKMQDGTYAKYGAHLDDSTMTQVYNAVNESDESILAVKDTYGMVPFYNGSVIQAYFFSTSCGVTCTNADVWDGEALPYLTDKLENEAGGAFDFSEEAAFRQFIDDSSEYNCYEKDYPLFRWQIIFTPEEMTAAIQSTLQQRYETNPDKILTRQADGTYVSKPVSDIGQIVSVEVTKRGKSGIVKEITIVGTNAEIRVTGQTNARALISPADVTIHRQDGSESEGWTLIPSPFYYIMQTEDGNYQISGGGFGHGVGMSQNGTKVMTEQGYSAEDIIRHYYTGVEIHNIYQ